MPKIIKNGKEYSGVPIEVVTAWAPTADPVQVKEPLMGNTDISSIGDGTVTGAIDNVKTGLTNKSNLITQAVVRSGSLAVNGNATGYIDTNVVRSGYYALGIVGISGSGTGAFAIQDTHLITDNTIARVYVRNVTSASATINYLNLYILYVKE